MPCGKTLLPHDCPDCVPERLCGTGTGFPHGRAAKRNGREDARRRGACRAAACLHACPMVELPFVRPACRGDGMAEGGRSAGERSVTERRTEGLCRARCPAVVSPPLLSLSFCTSRLYSRNGLCYHFPFLKGEIPALMAEFFLRFAIIRANIGLYFRFCFVRLVHVRFVPSPSDAARRKRMASITCWCLASSS